MEIVRLTNTPGDYYGVDYLEDIRALYKELYGDEPRAQVPEGQLHKALTQRHVFVYGAIDDGRLIGITTLMIEDMVPERTARIEDVVVLEEYRNRGVGRLLVKRAIQTAKNKEAAMIDLKTRPENQGAIRFYEGLGFKLISREDLRFVPK